VEATDRVIGEIETVSQQYMPLSQACSNIYFTLDSLSQVHFLYQYSLQFFLDIFHSVLYGNARLKEQNQQVQKLDHGQRLSIIITSDLFRVVFCRVARGMLHMDRLTFALLLCRIHLRGLASEPLLDSEFDHFLRAKDGVVSNVTLPGH
jgi:dynein heavy chain 1